MKITDELLIDIGFIYYKERDEFVFTLPSLTVLITKTDKYWLYLNGKHPGSVVETFTDIITLISSHSFKLGVDQNRREIKSALGL